MNKILITGNSGYIGSHLSKMLLANNKYRITGLDIKPPQEKLHSQLQIDIRDKFYIGEHYDTVIHLAALVNVSESQTKPTSYYDTNLNGTINVLDNTHAKNFIFASTGAAEGCESAYGISKRAAEDAVREICEKKNIKFTIFRFYNVIGSDGFEPTNPDGLMYNLMKTKETGEFTIFGTDINSYDGTCVRDYVHVNEICDALRTAIEKPSNQIESLGHGVGHSVRDIVNLYKKVNNVEFIVNHGPRRKGDLAVSVLDNVSPYMKELYTLEQLLKVDN
jgi:UDP-glucose 4-epimerase